MWLIIIPHFLYNYTPLANMYFLSSKLFKLKIINTQRKLLVVIHIYITYFLKLILGNQKTQLSKLMSLFEFTESSNSLSLNLMVF